MSFADREAYFGDPDFVAVPLDDLLSDTFASERVKVIDPDRAFPDLPPAGETRLGRPDTLWVGEATENAQKNRIHQNTTVSKDGNGFSATPKRWLQHGRHHSRPGLCRQHAGRPKLDRHTPPQRPRALETSASDAQPDARQEERKTGLTSLARRAAMSRFRPCSRFSSTTPSAAWIPRKPSKHHVSPPRVSQALSGRIPTSRAPCAWNLR